MGRIGGSMAFLWGDSSVLLGMAELLGELIDGQLALGREEPASEHAFAGQLLKLWRAVGWTFYWVFLVSVS